MELQRVKTFKHFLAEEHKETHYATGKEALDGLGKAKFNAIIKHPTFDSHRMAMRMGSESKFDVTQHGPGAYKIEVGTHPYLTTYHMTHYRGPAKIHAYHHMVASNEDPKRYMTIKTHGYEHD
jgi:hypothetical protein